MMRAFLARTWRGHLVREWVRDAVALVLIVVVIAALYLVGTPDD